MECIECFFLILPIALLILGIPLWIVGDKSTNNKVTALFTTLPLIPNGSYPYSSYYISQGSIYNGQANPINITIPIRQKQVGNKEIYLLHNMWGFNIHANLIINNKQVMQIDNSQNINYSATYVPLTRHSIYEIPKLRSSFKKIDLAENIFDVFCPYSSDISQFQSIQPFCQSSSGYPAQVTGNYTVNKMFPSLKDYSYDSITINFQNSYLIPYDFIETPEAYIIFLRNSEKSAMRVAGIVITSIAIVLAFVFCLIIILASCC